MVKMTLSFEYVPVVDVHKDNFQEVWPSLLLSIKTATFVAIDTELSGLGERKLMMAKEIENRYKGTVESAKSRSIISLGLSCFRLINVATESVSSGSGDSEKKEDTNKEREEAPVSWRFLVQTFNIVTLCQEDYMVEPAALQFLVGHGFDFNRQYEKGIPYYRGCDRTGKEEKISLRQLFIELVQSKVPVVFHNAMVDLMFLYQNLYTNLPASSASFLADLTEMFPGGIFDTKYITDFVHRMPASYLEYAHGNCKNGQRCPKSHNVDLILDLDYLIATKKSRKRKRRKENQNGGVENDQNTMETDEEQSHNETDTVDIAEELNTSHDISCDLVSHDTSQSHDLKYNQSGNRSKAGGHRAGFDAFMTGFIMSCYISNYASYNGNMDMKSFDIDNLKNNIYLSGKDVPWIVSKSAFAKTSKQHNTKFEKIDFSEQNCN
ncbi:hypothetical protein KUTeg_016249 [Tegillarca granosa]|uniref:Target of EGR1 protein 1 n=1 Tax=Tegillarca granosa TaxID=220873 RepID=A0ABQ9EKA9_TEGGR|nr:hypothetical protein KUTeg_016249 [Tegillarca granosa]